MDIQQRLLEQQKELFLVQNKPRIEEQSLNSTDVIGTLVSHQNVDEITTRAIMAGLKGYKALVRSQDDSQTSSCILVHGPDPSKSTERDFTTNGTQGSLQCPFSLRKDGPKIQIDSCGQAEMDPIKAELEGQILSKAPSAPSAPSAQSVRSSQCPVSRCPIRFLDKHSPEEVAAYVERHKHEIPRSHAICVKRYQRDPQNMRQLDAKYGGLINMISGLSAKHQVFLPNQPSEEAIGNGDGSSSRASTERVEKWAENVDSTNVIDEGIKDEREGRFERPDRPLRDVRLGESPSRPWGIPVPIPDEANTLPGYESAASMPPPARPNHLDKSPQTSTKPAGGCPFHIPKATDSKPEAVPETEPEPEPEPSKLESPWANWGNSKTAGTAPKTDDDPPKPSTNMPANVIFNGPVFFGYSADQVAALMKQFGNK